MPDVPHRVRRVAGGGLVALAATVASVGCSGWHRSERVAALPGSSPAAAAPADRGPEEPRDGGAPDAADETAAADADCPPPSPDEADWLAVRRVVLRPLEPAGPRPGAPCPVGTTSMRRVAGIGESDVAEVEEWICQRPDGVVDGPYEARMGASVLGRGRYGDGLREGDWSFGDPGGGALEGPFVHGRRHGLWTSKHPDGSLAWRGRFRCGAREDEFTWWYPGGTPQQKGWFVHDMPEGDWTYYWPSGARKASGRMEDGAKVGAWSFWDETGAPLDEPPPQVRER